MISYIIIIVIYKKTLTCWANSIGVLVLGTEHCHLDHAQENDASYPELDAQQVFPVARGPDEPEQSVQDVDNAHHHVELKKIDKQHTTYKHTKDQLHNVQSQTYDDSKCTVEHKSHLKPELNCSTYDHKRPFCDWDVTVVSFHYYSDCNKVKDIPVVTTN